MASSSYLVRRAYRLSEKILLCYSTTSKSRFLEASSRFSGSRSYVPTPISFDQQWLKSQLLMMRPKTRSLTLTKVEGKHIVIKDYAVKPVEGDDDLNILVKLDGIGVGVEDVEARVDGIHLLVQGTSSDGVTTYLAGMNIPFACDKKRGVKWLMMGRDGRFIVTLHTFKSRLRRFTNLVYDIFQASHQISKLQDHSFVFSAALFDRAYLHDYFFPSIAGPDATSRSFTNYKNTRIGLYVKTSSGESEQMESTGECLCVSLKMPGFEIEDVTFSVEYNNAALLVEGKTDSEHYLACFHIPEGYETEIGNIKTEMRQGVYKATLSRKHAN